MGIEKYSGRVAVVTGGSGGIGGAIVEALLSHGLTVVALDKVKPPPSKQYADKHHFIETDVTDEDSIRSAFKWVDEHLGGVDILINAAGLIRPAKLTSTPTTTWKLILDVNVLGLSICTREAVQNMQQRGVDDGFIIHICSETAHLPPFDSDSAMYAASKVAVRTLLEGLRKDLVAKKSKIRVGAVSPGVTRTPLGSHFPGFSLDIFDKIPHLEPKDVAETVVFMLSQPPHVQIHDILMFPVGATHST